MDAKQTEKLVRGLRGSANDLLAAAQLLAPLAEQSGGKEKGYLAILNRGLYRMIRIIDHLELAEGEDPFCAPELLDLAGLCREVSREVEGLARGLRVEYRCELEQDSLLTEADDLLLEKAILNMVANAAEAASPGGHVSLRMGRRGDLAMIWVKDDGPGITAPEPDADPFLKRKGGVGLGLPLVRRVAALHGGTLMLENEERGGTTAVLSIPIRNSGEVLKSPLVDRTGGFSQTLVELSELLPAQYFGPNDVN